MVAGMQILSTKRANLPSEGMNGLCCVFRTKLSNCTNIEGTKVKTEIRLMAMPLASAKPRSGPILNCMAASAIKPMQTVQPLEKTATDALQHDCTMSSAVLPWLPRSSLKRCSKKTEKSSAMATCKIEPAELVTKLISPKMRLVPQLMKTETPSPRSTRIGSAQLVVVMTKMSQIIAITATVMMLI